MTAQDRRDEEELDRLLALSAPDVVTITDDLVQDMDHVAVAARAEIGDERPRPRRIPRLLAGLGLAALLIGGGAGAAVAAGGFTWLPWAENPDVAYTFTLPSGRSCEERVVLERTWFGGDWKSFVADARRLTVNDADVTQIVLKIRNPNSAVPHLNAAGQLRGPTPATGPTDDDWYAAGHHVALGKELRRLARAAGLGDNWNSNEKLQCSAVAR